MTKQHVTLQARSLSESLQLRHCGMGPSKSRGLNKLQDTLQWPPQFAYLKYWQTFRCSLVDPLGQNTHLYKRNLVSYVFICLQEEPFLEMSKLVHCYAILGQVLLWDRNPRIPISLAGDGVGPAPSTETRGTPGESKTPGVGSISGRIYIGSMESGSFMII